DPSASPGAGVVSSTMPASTTFLLVLSLATFIALAKHFGPRFLAWLKTRGVSQRRLDALARLGRIALAVVEHLEGTFVAERKNPATPSVWNDAAKREVKAIATSEVLAVAQPVLAELLSTGSSPQRLLDDVSEKIEDAVRMQKDSGA
ncbi:MAG: hypothetical protein ABI862_07930, partial [Ilumatobacteraceae bacterium]